MSVEEKWSQRNSKPIPLPTDEVLVIDRESVPITSKRITLLEANRIQSIPNVVVVTESKEFPDAVTADIDNVADDGSGLAEFTFTFNPLSPAFPYLEDQTVEIVGASVAACSDREAL